MFKLLACSVLCTEYDISRWNLLLPTGCDYVLEEVVKDLTGDIDFEIINENIKYIIMISVPIIGIFYFLNWIVWRKKMLYLYIVPSLCPELSDWEVLFYTLIPTLFYIKIWRK